MKYIFFKLKYEQSMGSDAIALNFSIQFDSTDCSGIFPNTFPQLVNGSKNSILNWVIKLNHFLFFCLFLNYPWKIFHSIHLLFLLFGLDTYKHAWRKVVCISLVNFSFPWDSKIPRKMHFPAICRPKFQNFFFHWGYPTEPLS